MKLKINFIKPLSYVLMIAVAVTGLMTIMSNSQWTSSNNVICPQGSTRIQSSLYCTDGTNIYGLFPQRIIDLCKTKSTGGSLACTNQIQMDVIYVGKNYKVSLNRYSYKFFQSFANTNFCPTGTSVVTANQLCKDGTDFYGSFSPVFIEQCLAKFDANTCLRNRMTQVSYNALVANTPTAPKPVEPVNPSPAPTPDKPSDPTPAPVNPTPTPKLGNQYDVSKVKQTAVRTIYPNDVSYFNFWEGFDYSGNFKQVYDKYNHQFNGNEILIGASKKWTPNPAYNPASSDLRYSKSGAGYGGTQLMLKDRITRGYISFEAKIPNFAGAMPAFWLLNRDNPNYFAEVDCFETPGSEVNNVYSVTHYGTSLNTIKTDYKSKNVPNLSTTYNKFEIYKTSDKVVTLINGQLLYERSMNQTLSNGINGLDAPMEFIMNFNIGDKWSGTWINDARLPASVSVKNLKVEFYK
ncbi:MAG: family 16 glycosylhydrolase [Patescibacteria group bacterium]